MSNLGLNLNSRIVAVDVLNAVLNKEQRLETSFSGSLLGKGLCDQDRAFSRQLIFTTLRRLGQIDDLISKSLLHPKKKISGKIQNLMRVGVCQLVFLRTNDYAAISTTVDLAKSSQFKVSTGLINAVLRRVQRDSEVVVKSQDKEQLNTPGWLWSSWKKFYGEEKTRAIAQAHMLEPLLDLSFKDEPGGDLIRLNGIILPWGTVRCKVSGEITNLPGFREGRWWVQDSASRIAVKLLGNVTGKTVVDMCAAPGGKTLFLANLGAKVIAIDISKERLTNLTKNLSRLNLNAEVIEADGINWRPTKKVDYVLLDAPCSSTGIIRRHPDVAHLKKARSIKTLASTQLKLLESASKILSGSGAILFCTCSLQYEEGVGLVKSFLEKHPDFKLDKISGTEVFRKENHSGVFQSLPSDFRDLGGVSGFFAARLKRK